MSAVRYFLAYRYTQRGNIYDGNTVLNLDTPVTTEAHIREIEAFLAGSRSVEPGALGLTNIVVLASDPD